MGVINTLSNKYILLTGGTSGIGFAIAKYLDSQGVHLILVTRNKTKQEEVISDFTNAPIIIQCDLSNMDDIAKIFKYLENFKIILDGFIHSAGICEIMPLKNIESDQMAAIMTVNCFSFVEICKYFTSKKYANSNSKIIAISSLNGLVPEKGKLSYAISKSALNMAVKTIALELVKRKISVNGIAPAFVKTALFDFAGSIMPDIDDYLKREQPLGIIPVESIVESVSFLLSDVTGYMTGEIITINAGGHIL